MVKIIQPPLTEGTNPKLRPKRSRGGDFESVFQSAVTQDQAPAGPVPPMPLTGLDAVAAGSDLSRVERVVDMLDKYRQLLADPKVPLKKAGVLVDGLDREADWLALRAAQIDGPAGLKDLLARTALTAKIEALKYQRGDYV